VYRERVEAGIARSEIDGITNEGLGRLLEYLREALHRVSRYPIASMDRSLTVVVEDHNYGPDLLTPGRLQAQGTASQQLPSQLPAPLSQGGAFSMPTPAMSLQGEQAITQKFQGNQDLDIAQAANSYAQIGTESTRSSIAPLNKAASVY
jgi:hypothetical protein